MKTRQLTFSLAVLLALTISCGQKSNKQTLQLDNFTYCAYTWRQIPHDTIFDFYLIQYINIDKEGNCRIMHRFKDSVKYFSTTTNDTLITMLNALFLNKIYKEKYKNPSPDRGMIYCGGHYLINYSSPKTGQHNIKFLDADWTPSQILNLKSYLDSNLLSNSDHSSSAFDLTTITDSLKKYFLRTDTLIFHPITDTLIFTVPARTDNNGG